LFADVIIDIQHEKLDKIFQYRIPERLEHEVEAGMAVVVPFGKGNRKTKGYVTALSKTSAGTFTSKVAMFFSFFSMFWMFIGFPPLIIYRRVHSLREICHEKNMPKYYNRFIL